MVADAGDTGEALPRLQRCRQIVGAGENWFGLACGVQRAEAVVAAARGEYVAAENQFKKANRDLPALLSAVGGSRHPTSNSGAAHCQQRATAHAPSKSSTPLSKSTARAELIRA